MRLASLLGPDLKDTLASEPEALREALDEFHPEDIAEIIEELTLEDAVALVRLVPDELGAHVLERLSNERQVEILHALGTTDAVPIVREMAADDRVDLVQDLPEELALELLQELVKVEPEVAEEVRELGAYPEETGGGLMTPEYIALTPETKVWQAIDEVRRASREGRAETVHSVYVVAFNQLVGVASLRDLILAEPGETLGDIMTEKVVKVLSTDDQEAIAATIAKYDLNAVPVVSEHGDMLGVVTVDDVVDVVIEEATEDAQMMAGVVPLEDSYFDTKLTEFIWKRGLWLIILFLGELLTASVMESNESVVTTTAGLVVFVPLIIASGGNSGSQSSSLVIRALAVGEMLPRDWLRVLMRELVIGIGIGLLLGAVGFSRAFLIGEDASLDLAITVAASVVAVVTLGTLMGSLLPLGIKRIGLDPAVSSTPFIASLVDVVGLLVYFAIAKLVFGLAIGAV